MDKIIKKNSKLVARKIGSEYILVPVVNNIADMNKIFTMNEVGSFIWDQVDGKKCVSEIITSVHSQFEIDKDQAQKDVLNFLKKGEKVLFI